MVGAVRSFDGITMVSARTMFWVVGHGTEQLVPLLDAVWESREDMVPVGSGMSKVADLRYRNFAWPWRVELEFVFKPELISAESIVALVDYAGSLGLGDWRPSAATGGVYGQWTIDEAREVAIR